MQIRQMPEARKMVEAYQEGYITIQELREELEWYRDKTIDKESERLIVEFEDLKLGQERVYGPGEIVEIRTR